MHELAIAQSILSLVMENVGGGGRVKRVMVTVGRLSGVVPDSLKFCFEAASKGTMAENAELVIEEVPGMAHCPECGGDTDAGPYDFVCPSCGGFLHVSGGKELYLDEVEME